MTSLSIADLRRRAHRYRALAATAERGAKTDTLRLMADAYDRAARRLERGPPDIADVFMP
ncbi:hypothetical protein [Allosphingosinicella deserti]|uniref:Uncharacterized protein n=1 Tax=Allosphingosinicella deserti TaxID=2116704 RepID=A0A2P7QEI8_9SPHN|nr:hypothetical protein [Sphingomonas deserti]PSJ36379.1 hypothetical protein C7I55_26405 [Sphingomonas deserti]